MLIVVPASLTWQWHEEMLTKFHEEFAILENLKQLPPAPPDSQSQHPELVEEWQVPCRWIISLARAKSARWSERLLAREYDLLIVDEAHKLKNHRTQAYRFVNSVCKRVETWSASIVSPSAPAATIGCVLNTSGPAPLAASRSARVAPMPVPPAAHPSVSNTWLPA